MIIWARINFLRGFQKFVISPKILIVYKIKPKTFFGKKNNFFQNDRKKRALPQNGNIYGDMDQKRCCSYELKKLRFRPYIDIFAYIGKKRLFHSDRKTT